MRKALRDIVVAGLIIGVAVTALGMMANWFPALDFLNDGLPLLTAGALVLLAISLVTRRILIIVGSLLLFGVNLLLLFVGMAGAVPAAPDGRARFMRVITFNIALGSEHIEATKNFLLEVDADVVVLQEVQTHHKELLARLSKTYRYRVGDRGLVILSKYRITADGRIDRASRPLQIIRWAKLDVNGEEVQIAGTHLARPFNPELHQADIISLTEFVLEQSGALIVAGDFNMTPWTFTLKTFAAATRLQRFNTFYPTWPMRWRDTRLHPVVATDNVFASHQFASLGTTVGPYLGSDHRAVVADIARIEQAR